MTMQDPGSWYIRMMIRKGRNALGLSQRRIAEEIDRSTDTVRAWELGRHEIPAHSIENIAKACGLDDEVVNYMLMVARARRNGTPIEADMRYNALLLALGEEHAGDIFKWDALLIPGPLQTRNYHYTVAREAEPGTDQWVDSGWNFKMARRSAIEGRSDRPKLQFLIGEMALLLLRQKSTQLYREQIDLLRKYSKRPGLRIRILASAVRANQSNFEIYRPGDSRLVGPPFVYTEGHDWSRCITDPAQFGSYDDFRKARWKQAIRIEDSRYDD